MSIKIGIYIDSAQKNGDTNKYEDCFSPFEIDVNRKHISPRGGEWLPDLSIFIQISATVVGSWVLQGVGSDFYKLFKRSLKSVYKAFAKDRKMRSAWLVLSFEYDGHSFIVDFDISDDDGLEATIKSLPRLIKKLSSKKAPNHHLISWQRRRLLRPARWQVTLQQTLDDAGFVIDG